MMFKYKISSRYQNLKQEKIKRYHSQSRSVVNTEVRFYTIAEVMCCGMTLNNM